MDKKIILKRMLRSKFFMIGALGVIIIVLISLLAPKIITHNPYTTRLTSRFVKPEGFSRGSDSYILGTDQVGRDIFSRILIEAVTHDDALIASVCSGIIGTILGVVAGYYGKTVEMIIMRLCDIMSAIPTLLLAIAVLAVLGISTPNLVGVMIATRWVSFTRIMRNQVKSNRNREFVLASKALGAPDWHIMWTQIFPNTTTPLLIEFSQSFGKIIMLEASLSFLNMGIQPPTPSWGSMISAGRSFIAVAPWVVIFPGCCLMITVLSFNFLGDGLRDVLDPKRL